MMQAMELFRARIGVGSLTGGAPLIAMEVMVDTRQRARLGAKRGPRVARDHAGSASLVRSSNKQ
jgi:hypothetical protein